jgi:hypothetical protein
MVSIVPETRASWLAKMGAKEAQLRGLREERVTSANADAREARALSPQPPRRGRPPLELAHTSLAKQKPWLTNDPPMSRATWFRRQHDRRSHDEGP